MSRVQNCLVLNDRRLHRSAPEHAARSHAAGNEGAKEEKTIFFSPPFSSELVNSGQIILFVFGFYTHTHTQTRWRVQSCAAVERCLIGK